MFLNFQSSLCLSSRSATADIFRFVFSTPRPVLMIRALCVTFPTIRIDLGTVISSINQFYLTFCSPGFSKCENLHCRGILWIANLIFGVKFYTTALVRKLWAKFSGCCELLLSLCCLLAGSTSQLVTLPWSSGTREGIWLFFFKAVVND